MLMYFNKFVNIIKLIEEKLFYGLITKPVFETVSVGLKGGVVVVVVVVVEDKVVLEGNEGKEGNRNNVQFHEEKKSGVVVLIGRFVVETGLAFFVDGR